MPDCLISEIFFYQNVESWQKKNEVKLLWCLANVASDWRSRTALTAAGFLPQDSPGTQRFEVKDLLQDLYIVVLWVFNEGVWLTTIQSEKEISGFQSSFPASAACLAAGICINTQKSLKSLPAELLQNEKGNYFISQVKYWTVTPWDLLWPVDQNQKNRPECVYHRVRSELRPFKAALLGLCGVLGGWWWGGYMSFLFSEINPVCLWESRLCEKPL